MEKPKIIAFLLPQFHRVAENDEWWGEGFTEWTNVRKAEPRFRGHRQPRRPVDDFYYDLSEEGTREWQARLAKEHCVYGFCYYHYWFKGRQLLEKPINSMVEMGTPDFPFCVAWANEPWTRAWDGGERDILMPQEYGDESDWRMHFKYLEKLFKDSRYIKVNGNPLLLIYRTTSIEKCEEMLFVWRKLAVDAGFPGLHVVSMLTIFPPDKRTNLFDAFVEFEPGYTQSSPPGGVRAYEMLVNGIHRLSWKLFGGGLSAPRSRDYRILWAVILRRALPKNHYPGAFVDWDNSPRRSLEASMIMRHATVSNFKRAFDKLYAKARKTGSRFIFINAWNEWGEGTYLEPDTKNGKSHLESIKSIVSK